MNTSCATSVRDTLSTQPPSQNASIRVSVVYLISLLITPSQVNRFIAAYFSVIIYAEEITQCLLIFIPPSLCSL